MPTMVPADDGPRPNNKVKTSKALQGKKGAKSNTLHPKSRRAKQVARVGLRDEKLAGVRWHAGLRHSSGIRQRAARSPINLFR